MAIAVITGTSKGLGASLAKFLLDTETDVIGLSRTNNAEIEKLANERGQDYTFIQTDLTKINEVQQAIENIKDILSKKEYPSQLYIINNAAMVEPIKKGMQVDAYQLQQHYQLNVISPMVLLNSLLSYATEKGMKCIGVNITSGAAENPYYGWSAYCSSKASLNMYTKTIALEQEELDTGHKVFAFSPGKMDTNMQEEIRSTQYEHFIDVEAFKYYKENNILSDTEEVGSVLIDIMFDETTMENGKIYKVQDYV